MANYRPKSLDELNNLYGKSLNAQQEIVKKASVLEEKTQPKKADSAPAETKPGYITREQTADDQISGYVNDFIKSFGTPKKPDRTAVATVTASMKTVPVGKPAEPKKENEAVKAAAENHTDDKPRLIRNSERNSLFENYKKVMDDEDDEDVSDSQKEKRKPKKLFEKKSAKADEEKKTEDSAEEKKPEEQEKKTESAAEVKKEAEAVKPAPEKKAEAIVETEVETKEEAETAEEVKEKKKRSKAKKEKPEKVKKEKKQKSAKKTKESHGTVSRAVVMFLVFCVLLSAVGVGSVKAFSGINTDSLVMGKYLLYTADRDYSRLGIGNGDLVVVEYKGVDYDDIVAYKKSADEYGFAKLTTVLNDESVIGDDGDLRCLIFNDTVRGVVCKTIPAVGAVAAFIMSDFLAAIGILLVLAVILMLIAVFGCKPKQKKEKVKKEKVKKEKKEKPEKVKKEKKSRKDKKAQDADEDKEEDQDKESGYDDEDDLPDFDAIEADFNFLLQDNDDAEAENEPDQAEEAYEAEEAEEAVYEPFEAEESTEAADEAAEPEEVAEAADIPSEESEAEEAVDDETEEAFEELFGKKPEEKAEAEIEASTEEVKKIVEKYVISDYTEEW